MAMDNLNDYVGTGKNGEINPVNNYIFMNRLQSATTYFLKAPYDKEFKYKDNPEYYKHIEFASIVASTLDQIGSDRLIKLKSPKNAINESVINGESQKQVYHLKEMADNGLYKNDQDDLSHVMRVLNTIGPLMTSVLVGKN